jgi:hypothetical protein
LKHPLYISFARLARLRAVAEYLKWPVFFMALYKMGYALEKGRAVINSGGKFALLAHGEREPKGLVKDYNYTEIWGSFK